MAQFDIPPLVTPQQAKRVCDSQRGPSAGSVANRLALRCDPLRTLKALWEHREALRQRSGQADKVENAHGRLLTLINRIEGQPDNAPANTEPATSAFDRPRLAQIKKDLVAVSSLAPKARGYAFAKFLKDRFDAHGLAALEPFRLRDEQIDGSFQFGNETYLLEAKWHGQPTFHGKIEQKAAWTRGLFVSNSGFTDEGLHAFGRGKRVICIDGFDLCKTLDRLNHVLERKVRRAAETGSPFIRVRDLFPH
jgi:hypothetical protein